MNYSLIKLLIICMVMLAQNSSILAMDHINRYISRKNAHNKRAIKKLELEDMRTLLNLAAVDSAWRSQPIPDEMSFAWFNRLKLTRVHYKNMAKLTILQHNLKKNEIKVGFPYGSLVDQYGFYGSFFKGSVMYNDSLKKEKNSPNVPWDAYKIHFMPKEKDFNSVIMVLLTELAKNQELSKRLHEFKIFGSTLRYTKHGNGYIPGIVLYPIDGKDNVQYLLDGMEPLFKKFKGCGKPPRCNVQFDPRGFTWYSTGEGFEKAQLFEQGNTQELAKVWDPATNYALPKTTQTINPYLLVHPK